MLLNQRRELAKSVVAWRKMGHDHLPISRGPPTVHRATPIDRATFAGSSRYKPPQMSTNLVCRHNCLHYHLQGNLHSKTGYRCCPFWHTCRGAHPNHLFHLLRTVNSGNSTELATPNALTRGSTC